MVCINVLFGFLLTVYTVIVFTEYGFRFNLRADFSNLSVCIRIYVFEWIEIASFDVFVCQGKFIYSLSGGEFKTLSIKKGKALKKEEKSENKEQKEIKTDYLSMFKNVIADIPEISLRSLYIGYSLSGEDEMKNALYGGAINTITAMIKGALSDKLKIQNCITKDISSNGIFKGVTVDAVIGFSIFKILFYIMHIITLRRKFTSVKSLE